jgi:TRAP-type uncharacterized transport system substrate-binding protein
MLAPTIYISRMLAKLSALYGRSQVVSMGVLLFICVVAALGVLVFLTSAAPNSINIASGPKGSAFQNNAEKYKKILAKEGVTLNIVSSEGSMDNLKKLTDPKTNVDVGFVLGGEVNDTNIDKLVSLGSISYQPLMIFYRGKPRTLLSDFKGQRLNIGQQGSGTYSLALTLLKANGIVPNGETSFVSTFFDNPMQELLDDHIDAVFLMSDSTSTDLIRKLMHSEDIHLFNFIQADGYTRRINYLNKLELPRGSLDFGKNIPEDDLYLVGPTVELVARNNLHPALSDLLLEAAKEVHSAPGLFKKRGEFPAPLEHEFHISSDASRYYVSGKSYLYRTFPFWVASLLARGLEIILPIVLLLIPAFKIIPAIYRWRIESRIYRWYRVLFELERDAFKHSIDENRREELLRHLDRIEHSVNKVIVPASCGNLFYGLREHINFVRDNLLSQHSMFPVEAKKD